MAPEKKTESSPKVEEPKKEPKEEQKKEEPKKEEPKTEEPKVSDKGDAEKAKEQKPKEEKPKELEEDSTEDSRPRAKGPVVVSEVDCSMDASISHDGSVISSLGSGGLQFLVSGARATVGTKAGRYYFEAKMLERKSGPGESYCRLGFSTLASSLCLGDRSCDGNCYFDSTPKWGNNVIGLLLNLVEGSANEFTYSLFINGARASPPKALADSLKEALKGGAGLFPTVSFNNMTLICNFGQTGVPMKPLPFKVRMFGDISKADAVSGPAAPPKGSKCEVVVPVGLPEEGLFDWADKFLETNPSFVELSDRALMAWCKRSGLQCPRQGLGGVVQQGSRDRPGFHFGIKDVDNRSANRCLQTLSQLQRRNFLVLEAKGNLLKASREELINRFSAPHFTKRAVVAVGEPKAEFKSWVHKAIKVRHESKKDLMKKRSAERAERKAAKARGKGKKEKDETKTEVDEKEEESKHEPELPEPEVGPNVWFTPKPNGLLDVSKDQINQSFESFEFPTASEGFDKVDYEWCDKSAAVDHLKKWQKERKATSVMKDLKPSEWFKEKLKAWQETKKEYKKKHSEYLAIKRKEKKEEPADFDDTDLTDCKDVNDCGEGVPVYAKFEYDDWVLLSWRYELYLLAHGFKHDVQDPDRPGLPEDHMEHYYKLYLGQDFNPKRLGCKDLAAVVQLLSEAVKLDGEKTKILAPIPGEDADIGQFVVQTEQARRDRLRRVEAGDESCKLNIPRGGGENGGKGGKGKSDRGQGGQKGNDGGGKGFAGKVSKGSKDAKRPFADAPSGDRHAKFRRVETPPTRAALGGSWVRVDAGYGGSYQQPSKGSAGKGKGGGKSRSGGYQERGRVQGRW